MAAPFPALPGGKLWTPDLPRQKLVGPLTQTIYTKSRFLGIRTRNPTPDQAVWLTAVYQVQGDEAEFLPLTPQAYKYRVASLADPWWTKESAEGVKDFLTLGRKMRFETDMEFEITGDDGTTVTIRKKADDFWVKHNTVEDSRTREDHPARWLTPHEFDAAGRRRVNGYERWRRLGQKWVPEVWVEAVGSMTLVTDVAHRWGASVLSSGGVNSENALIELAHRAVRRFQGNRQRTVIVLIGDHDPTGKARMDRAMAETHALLCSLYGLTPLAARSLVRFEWAAVTPDQIHDWRLIASDEAGTKFEVESIPSQTLRDHLEDVLGCYTSVRLLNRVIAASETERAYKLSVLPAEAPPWRGRRKWKRKGELP
jgi:hypothetical protein